VNDAWTAMSGWAPSEFPTLQDWIARAHGADGETVGAHLASIHTGDALRREEELLVTTRSGETRTWVWASAPLSRSPDGRSLAISMATDVTEQRRDEAELRLQVAALNSAADAIVITNHAGKIEWVNRAFTRLSGYSAAEAIGRSPGELVKSGSHPDSFYAALWETILSGNVWRGEVTNRRKDGSLYPESLTITPVVGESGDTAHFVAIKRDLTELKQLEAQYRQAQKMESIGRLAGGIAHDFNNLLTVIIGRAELVLSRLPEDDPNRNGIRQIHEAGERAARLTRQLLAFSRKQILQPAVIDVGHLVLDWRGVLDRLIGEAVELVVTAPEDAGRVKADPGQLEQVIMNLVVNARDAMPDGGRLTIEVRSESQADALPSRPPGRYVVLAVSDTGIGMDAATLEQVFEPFFTTKGPGEGTGLGLATVYGIIRQSGGYLRVESRVGVGTTFTVSLPRVDDELAAVTDRSAPLRRGAETVLVVEDEAALRELAESVLDSAGYRVLTAAHGREAIECLEREGASVDLVFTDVVLPGMNGRNLAEHVARTHPEIRILFTSGYTGDAELRDGVLKSSAHFLAKPYTVAQLLAAVRDVLDAPR
jgi:PAS domain S-box-containing protein